MLDSGEGGDSEWLSASRFQGRTDGRTDGSQPASPEKHLADRPEVKRWSDFKPTNTAITVLHIQCSRKILNAIRIVKELRT